MKKIILCLIFLAGIVCSVFAQTERIDSVVVSAELSLISKNKDTLIFNAKAINTLKGEFAIDILRQLPGVSIRGGKIYLNGRQVTETYVNGIKVFGDNPLTAFANIKAEDVLNISAYEQLTALDERRGIRNGKKENVLNIKTLNPILNQVSLLANLAAGADGQLDESGHLRPRYATSLNSNYFSEMFSVEAKGTLDNVDQAKNSITSERRLGTFHADMEKHWLDRRDGNTVKAGYSFNRINHHSSRWSRTDYLQSGSTLGAFSTDSSSVNALNNAHTVQVSADLMRTPLKTINALVSFSVASSSDSSLFRSENHYDGSGYYRNQYSLSTNDNWDIQSRFNWRDDDLKVIAPSVVIEYNVSSTNGISKDVDTLDTSLIQKYIEHTTAKRISDFSVLPSISATLINNDNVFLSGSLSYRLAQNSTEERRHSSEGSFSYDFNSASVSHFFNTAINSNIKSANVALYSTLELTQRSDCPILPIADARKDTYCFFAFLATLSSRSAYAELRVQPTAPDVVQMRNYAVVDNSLLAYCGNPQLTPSTNYSLTLRYSGQKLNNKLNYTLRGNAAIVSNPIIESIQHLCSDTQLSAWGNPVVHCGGIVYSYSNGNYSASADMTMSCTYRHNRALSLNSEVGISGKRMPQEVEGMMIVRNTLSPSFSLGCIITPNKKFRVTVNNQTFYSASSLEDNSGCLYRWNERASVAINGVFKKWNYKVFADIVYDSISGGLVADTICSYPSISLNRSFAKGRYQLGFTAKDLLNAGQGYVNVITPDYVSRTWSPSFGRYVLISFRYSFRRNNK